MCPPTVLMGIDRTSTRDWKQAREQMISILDSNGLGSVAVIIRKDISPLASGEMLETLASVEECELAPNMGAALAPKGLKNGNGTLGGWVEVKMPGKDKYVRFALTCAHCCFLPLEELYGTDLTGMCKPAGHSAYN
jgi:hypothetical protein